MVVSDHYKTNMLTFFFLSAYVSIHYSKVNENGAKVFNILQSEERNNKLLRTGTRKTKEIKGLAFKVEFEYDDE